MKPMKLLTLVLWGGLVPAAPAEEPNDREPGAWLGVQLSPVPSAVASHLKLEAEGVMVRNVFRDSPAADAGIERYDVIVAADGQAVTDGVEGFRDNVLDKKPGEEINLDLVRRGERRTVAVKLAAAPDSRARFELKYEDDPDLTQWQGLGMRGRILRPGPQGWIMEDLGDAPWLHELPDWLEEEFERRLEFGPGDDLTESRRVDSEGRELTVRRMPDGTIEVRRETRTDDGTNADVHTYKDADELKDADREAYDLLNSHGRWDRRGPGFTFRRPGGDGLRDEGPMSNRWREWNDRFFRGPLDERDMLRRLERDDETPATRPADRPTTRFETHPDGSVSVHVRKGDTELSTTYPSAEQLQKEAPELFDRYQDIRKALE